MLRIPVLVVSLALVVAATQSFGASLRGKVHDKLGWAIAGAEVELWSEEEPDEVLRGKTNEFGVYVFDGLVKGEYTMNLSSNGFKFLTVKSIRIPGSGDVSVPSLTLEVGGMCGDGPILDYFRFVPANSSGNLGGVVWVDGSTLGNATAVVDAEIALLCGDGTSCRTTRSDSHGRFLFEHLPPGEHTIRVSRPGFYPEFLPRYEVRAGHELIYHPIRLEPCFEGNCAPSLRPERPLVLCE